MSGTEGESARFRRRTTSRTSQIDISYSNSIGAIIITIVPMSAKPRISEGAVWSLQKSRNTSRGETPVRSI